MKFHPVVCAVLAMSMTFGGPAFAQGDGPQEQGTSRLQSQRAQRNAQQQQQRQRGWDQQQRQRNAQQQQQRGYEQQQQQRGYEQQQEQRRAESHEIYDASRFHRGDRLPPEYRHRNYVVDDWRGHHLNAPPRGSQWVQVGGDYVLVAIATGIIMQLLLNH